jgi:molybdopterin adenylyltransferase
VSAGVLRFVCVSTRKGTPKQPVERAELREGQGIVGDAHAGDWHRQLSLLDEADIDGMRAKGLELPPGAFGENLVVRGLDLAALGVGTVLEVGNVELAFTQIGKVCHARCAIYAASGDCIMPRMGVFAEVRRGGVVAPGAPVRVLEAVPRAMPQAAVLTVSDRCAAGELRDTAGPAVAEALQARVRVHLAWAGVVPDDAEAIGLRLKDLAGRGIHLVLTVGGTGLSPRDVTPEATRAVIEREVPGLAEAMRAASAGITPNAWLSRGVAGLLGGTLIVNLPGSRKAALENLEAILPALPHAVTMLAGDAGHPESDAGRWLFSAETPDEPA